MEGKFKKFNQLHLILTWAIPGAKSPGLNLTDPLPLRAQNSGDPEMRSQKRSWIKEALNFYFVL